MGIWKFLKGKTDEELEQEEFAKLQAVQNNPTRTAAASVLSGPGALTHPQPPVVQPTAQSAPSAPTKENTTDVPKSIKFLNTQLKQNAAFGEAFEKLGILFMLLKFDLRTKQSNEISLLEYLGFDRNILLKYFYAIFGKFNISGNDGGEEIKRIMSENEMMGAEEKNSRMLKPILCNEVLDIGDITNETVINAQLTKFKTQIARINDLLPVRDYSKLRKVIIKIRQAELSSRWLSAINHIAIAGMEGGYTNPVPKQARTAVMIGNLDVLDTMIEENGGNPSDIPTPNQKKPPAISPTAPGSQGPPHQPPRRPVPPAPTPARPAVPLSVTPSTVPPAQLVVQQIVTPLPVAPAPQPAPVAPAQPAAPAVIELTEIIEPIDDDSIIEEEPALPESIVNDYLLDFNQDKIDEIMKDYELAEALTDLTELFLCIKRPDIDISAIRDAIDATPAGQDEILGSTMVAAKEANVITLICRIFKIEIDNQAAWAVKIKQIHNECKDGKIYELLKPATPAAAPASPAQKPSAPVRRPRRRKAKDKH